MHEWVVHSVIEGVENRVNKLSRMVCQLTLSKICMTDCLGVANKKILNIAGILRLSDVVSHAATRLYILAVEHKFTKGRKSLNVVAVCLYVACRQKETRNYMLIDFSDLLQVTFRSICQSKLYFNLDCRSTFLSSDTRIYNSYKH
jgi:transcription initiation factor TFIIIB Brf1 subunit/transcription initiation factor TFIIB